jgi:UDP-2,3-diacylglucosamine hydrolase
MKQRGRSFKNMVQPLLASGASLLIVSDVHLRSLADAKGELFCRFLEGLVHGAKVETLVLLGDIFDFTLGSNRFFRNKHQLIGDLLQQVAARGTRVIFVEGNHEFEMARHHWSGVETVSDFRFYLEVAPGLTIGLSHGDGICAPQRYYHFRSVVRSPYFLKPFRWIPGLFIDWLALQLSHQSRKQEHYRRVDHGRVLTLADEWFSLDGRRVDYGIFGHFHEPFAVERKQEAGRLICLPCWDVPNALVLREGRFERLFFHLDPSTRELRQRVEPVVLRPWESSQKIIQGG